MKCTKPVLMAAVAGAFLTNAFAYAQTTPESKKVLAMIDAWAVDMKQTVDTGRGERRRKDLAARTDKLNADLQGMACTFSDRGFYENSVESKAKALSVTVKARIDCNRELKIESNISFKDVATSLYEDDTAYNVALVSNNAITKWVSDWASEEKKAIDTIKDRPALVSKVADLARTYTAKFQNTQCHPALWLDIARLAEQEKRKRTPPLPINLNVQASCQGHRLQVTFEAALDTKTLDFKPTIDPKAKSDPKMKK